MKLLVASENGDGLGLATHLSSEGHMVNFIIRDTDSVVGRDIVTRNREDGAADIYIFDDTSLKKHANALRQAGNRVLGASRWEALLDDNEGYRNDIIRTLGWETTDSCTGVNLYVTAWFNGRSYVSVYASMVYRRFMNGGRGPDVNFTGIVSNFWQPTSRIESLVLKPLRRVLSKVNHRGCFHVHMLVNDDLFFVKDINASFTHPASLLLYENSRMPIVDILLRLFNEDSDYIKPMNQWGACVMVSIPPYPYGNEGIHVSIGGVQPANLKHMWLVDACRTGVSSWTTAGSHGKIGYVTARGTTVSEAARRVYRTINNLRIPDLQYRDDVGRNIHALLGTLRRHGWIK